MPSLRHMPRLGAKDCRRETLYVQMSGFSTSGAKHGGMALSEAKRLNGLAPEKWSSMKYGFRTGRRTEVWQGRDTNRKRLSPSFVKSTC